MVTYNSDFITNLSAYFDERIALIKELLKEKRYSNAFFCQNEELELNFSSSRVIRSLRFSLREKNFLHFRGIFCYTGHNSNRNLIEDSYTISLSSEYRAHDPSSCILNKLIEPFMFHTNCDDFPWIQIDFSAPADISALKVINRIGIAAERSRSLLIEISVDGQEWETVFDHIQLCDEFIQELQLIENDAVLQLRREDIIGIDRVLAECLATQFKHIPIYFNGLHDESLKSTLKEFISKKFLAPRKLEYTAYGLKKTFRFWSNNEKIDLIAESLRLIGILRVLTPNVFFAFGTALGFVREQGGFVPHDSDIDIMMVLSQSLFPTYKDAGNHVIPFLERNEYRIITRGTKSGAVHIRGTKKSHISRIDVFMALEDNRGHVSTFPIDRGRYLHANYLYPAIEITVLGMICPIPNNPFQYLDVTYGVDWRIPIDKNFHKRYRES